MNMIRPLEDIRATGALYDSEQRPSYLTPGQLLFSITPANVVTILGSCVAVALWDDASGFGGMNHFLLPNWQGGAQTTKYGDVANALLLARFEREGIAARRLQAKVFGGACMIEALRSRGQDLGAQNVDVAREFLRSRRIPIVEEDVHGSRGLRLSFRTDDGSTSVRHLKGAGDAMER
jgi:chemotaxis protein CheD